MAISATGFRGYEHAMSGSRMKLFKIFVPAMPTGLVLLGWKRFDSSTWKARLAWHRCSFPMQPAADLLRSRGRCAPRRPNGMLLTTNLEHITLESMLLCSPCGLHVRSGTYSVSSHKYGASLTASYSIFALLKNRTCCPRLVRMPHVHPPAVGFSSQACEERYPPRA